MLPYHQVKFMKGDCLRFVKLISSDIFQNKIVKAALWIVFLIHTTMTIITGYFFTHHLTPQEIFGYSPVFLEYFYIGTVILILLFQGKVIDNIPGELPLWVLNKATRKTYKEIRKEIIFIHVHCIANLIVVVVGLYYFLKFEARDNEYFFPFRFFEDYCADKSTILTFVYKSTFPIIGYLFFVHQFQLMYFTQHIRYQLMILINHIENLTDVAGTKREDKLFYDESYQEEIRKRLIFCFKRFKDFVLFTANKYTQLSNAVIIFMLTGYLLCVSVALNIIFGNILSYMRVTVMSVGTVSGLCGLMWSSQSLENIFEELLSEAIKINWYNFSESNKRMYLIFLVHLARDRKIKFSANYCLNYGLGLASARATYSIVSVAINIF
ncbi:hypothetical protein Zmor_016247 [Zophobas morio]|uniref:Odorant receptor n=1 Tax=Zophobas morio TaxID=2755281 RepID=A0AA38MIB9_9CUCU|nr:hypothetical protein Zmor_016247 [Zophobas morio]